MTMNAEILADPLSFPAVTGVSMKIIAGVAEGVVEGLVLDDWDFSVLEPGDGTRYELLIGRSWTPGVPYRFASSFGCLYPWQGTPTIHPDYAREKYVSNGNPWTAVVYALFLNTVALQLEMPPDPPWKERA